jgi:hypothetical protein
MGRVESQRGGRGTRPTDEKKDALFPHRYGTVIVGAKQPEANVPSNSNPLLRLLRPYWKIAQAIFWPPQGMLSWVCGPHMSTDVKMFW